MATTNRLRQMAGSRGRLAILGACLAVLVMCAPVSGQQFMRGDATGDGAYAVNDVVFLMSYLYSAGPPPTNGCLDPFTFDIADVNDNEFLTIADPLRLATALFIPGGSIPPPLTCGVDPGNSTNGFDVIDPAYEVRLHGPTDRTDPQALDLRQSSFEIALQIPGPVRAIELYFDYDPAELSNPVYDGPLPLGVTIAAFGVVRVTLNDALSPLTLSAGFNRLGHIVFDVAPGVLNPDIEWVSGFSDAFFRRGTVVDDNLEDHHPNFVRVIEPVFIRGDLDANGVYDVQDLIIWLALYIEDSASTLVSQCDGGPTEGDDVNDNEYLTIADYLLLATHIFCASSGDISSPIYCGIDPGNSTHGFDEVDTDYAIRATGFTLIGAGPIERDVEIPIQILSPEPVRGLQFILDLGSPDLSLDTPFFVPSGPLAGLIQSANRQVGSKLMVSIATDCDPVLETGSADWQDLGTLKLHLFGTELPNPIRMVPQTQIGDLLYRASIVTPDYQDHHPQLFAGENQFRRGDANNQGVGSGSPVDISDPIFMLSYLTGQGPFPQCLDAADANNDGRLDFADPIYTLNYLVGQLPPFPAPFTCGYESDIDELDCQISQCP